MRQAKLFGKTVKSVPKDIKLESHKFLYQAGFIRESVAGRYFLLPLGMKVRNKIISIIREEMDKSGAQEMLSPTLHPLELWQETNRANAGNFGLMKVEDRRGAKFALGGTAEEMFVDVVRKFQISHKDLPFNLYQFSQKFRDELRARGGLLRVREFTMKDAYSFDKNAEEFKATYEKMRETYLQIFERLGLKANVVAADNSYMGGEYSHELVVDCEAGESRYLLSEDGEYCAHEDVAEIKVEPVNKDEEVKEMETVQQPEWVKKMEDNVKHYNQPKWRFLKNVVYRNIETDELIIVGIRGDLEVNRAKVEHAVDAVEKLEEASEQDLKERLGVEPGYVKSWGHEGKGVRYVGDNSLKTVRNFIGGQKAKETDTINVNYGRDFEYDLLADLALAKEGDLAPDGKTLKERKGVEVGNIFQLGYHYTDKMKNSTFTDENSEEKFFYMGCYGIGIERTLQTIAELHRDERGIIWPRAIAPFEVHLISLNQDEAAEKIYLDLKKAGVDVLFDDRPEVSAGEKFADSDLIGCPFRLVVSEKTLKQNSVEVKKRNEKDFELIETSKLINFLIK